VGREEGVDCIKEGVVVVVDFEGGLGLGLGR
jgi:hypothetical protein